jgi:cyanophycin synthetase
MEILEIKVFKGPNYWSISEPKLIAVKLHVGVHRGLPTTRLGNFNQKLKNLLLGLPSHQYTRKAEGGLFERLEEGILLEEVAAYIALKLQILANMHCSYARTYSAQENAVSYIIFSYEIEEAGLYAAKAAIYLVTCLAEGGNYDYDSLARDLVFLRDLHARLRLGLSTEAIIKEAENRNIPYQHIKNTSLVIFGQGCNQKKIWAAVSSQTSAIAVDLVANKQLTRELLSYHFIPMAEGLTISNLAQLEMAIDRLQFPLVIKPLNANHGRGVTTNIRNKEKSLIAFTLAKQISDEVIVERFIQGEDYRFLLINYEVVAVAKRTPAMVRGDGIHTIQELIDEANKDPRRGVAHENVLTSIEVDQTTLGILEEKKLTLQSILPQEKILYLKHTANLSSGGTATDVTKQVHPQNIELAQRVAQILNLDVCGIDIIAEDIKFPLGNKNGAVIEVNAGPGLRMHISPNHGESRNVGTPFIDMLYPPGSPVRIPVVAVTGTNGKTTVVRLIAHLAKHFGYHTGYTTTEGIYVNDQLIARGDCSGPNSALVVLREPQVDFAVLECARGGILRSGLGFDQCNVSIITNITADHLGLEDIYSLDELTKVKAVVAQTTVENGYAILNAEDDNVYSIKDSINCHLALFALEENLRIQNHCAAGGIAAYVSNGEIIVRKGKERRILINVKEIPLTFDGTARCMVKNILPAVLTGIIYNFPLVNIRDALYNFYPSAENTPGRMNIFDFGDFQIMLDYAHNEDAYIELKNFLDGINRSRKIGIIAASGDRREKDIKALGYRAAEMFDEVIIRHNKDKRGRSNQQITLLLKEGIALSSARPEVKVISDEFSAVRYAIKHAIPNSFIYYSVDDVIDSLEFIEKEKKQFELKMETEEFFRRDNFRIC